MINKSSSLWQLSQTQLPTEGKPEQTLRTRAEFFTSEPQAKVYKLARNQITGFHCLKYVTDQINQLASIYNTRT